MPLIYKNEKTLYSIIFAISAVFWLALVIGTVGTVFIYLLFGFLFYLFAHSAFISHIKGSGVKVSEEQFPELYNQYLECCKNLDVTNVPDIYILNSDGMLNALATRFLRRHYVVLYSGVVDAMQKYPSGLNFYLGHELGHIKRGHLNWSTFIFPGMMLPLLGAAYSRAREYSCDLHGRACCTETKDAAFAVAVLAAGQGSWNKLNINAYMNQCAETNGFWMSLHEFTSDYPWLCKRMKHIVGSAKGAKTDFPKRNIFAAILALFVPRLGIGGAGGGLVSLMIVVAVVGILAAIALPAYQDYTVRAKVTSAVNLGNMIQEKATPYIQQNNELPFSLAVIELSDDLSNEMVSSVDVTDEGFVLNLTGGVQLEGETLVFQPYVDDTKQVRWRCDGGSLAPKFRPTHCR